MLLLAGFRASHRGGGLLLAARRLCSAAAAPTQASSPEPSSLPGGRTDREALNYDVLIVGAGPAGLSAAIKLKQAR